MFDLAERRLSRLARLDADCLRGGGRGVEKESLRVTPEGRIARTPHPAALGAAVAHPWITTDYSEALLEFVTPPLDTNWATLQFLCDIHQFVYPRLPDNEALWPTSMPCAVGGDESVPVAEYGSSNVGRMKHIYRLGLGYRYGRVMQTIAGVHFNYSLPEAFWSALGESEGRDSADRNFRDEMYFGLLRNFRRYGWIVMYLFGASPAVCKSFLGGRDPGLPSFDRATWYGPYATSLRMSDLGYRNTNQAGIQLSMNSLEEYIDGLEHAIRSPWPPYEKIGVAPGGQWRQLSTSALQIENEYYGYIRPKQPIRPGERPTLALRRAGVAYAEVRALDVSPYDPAGVSQNELRFLEALLVFCMLHDSPPLGAEEVAQLDANHARVAVSGRDPALVLDIAGQHRPLAAWGRELCRQLAPVCELLDRGDPARSYSAALELQADKVKDPGLTPSARILAEMREEGESFFGFAMRMSRQHADYFAALPPMSAGRLAEFEAEAAQSHEAQRELEDAPPEPFEDYLARYFAAPGS
ncbi:glutamate--cysteine ligase [Thioalkalivibrio sp. XN8]|uniref:glutamate--cysteine ligase n=1 Tax=Thioalkalivibrio sp. XN8 TaxID=2712863 RepID=UPI0013ED0C64|nr:glutamate--cysteine ligase [Thioalkalivibrio sp. XN8]NGP52608.1 glutamate--cysteine ligase [Thioalkalivibrio sp. XN8]